MPALNVPGWALYTITAAACFGGGVWSASRVFSGVENKAQAANDAAVEAKSGVATLSPRVAALEIQAAANGEKYAALMRQLDALTVRQAETSQDVKTLLSRLPPR
jgi:hypothetical protein